MNMLTTEKLTMSSSELAKLLGKEKSEVNRDIRKLFNNQIDDGEITSSLDCRGYVNEYFLPEVESKMYVAKKDINYLRTITEYWVSKGNEPEQPAWLANLSPQGLAAIEDLNRQVEEAKPKVEFVNRFCMSEGNKTFREVAKILKANEREFRQFLSDSKIMYRLSGGWTAYQNHIDAGRFHVSTGVADNEHAYTSCKFTPKGIEYVAGKWMARDL